MYSKNILLLFIILLAVFFRFNNLNWDSNFHLHPDERFLTMVGGAMQNPHSISDYLNPDVSTFNPANIGYKFYVYGTFPLTFNKLVAEVFKNDNYNSFTTQGRFLSALFDLFVVYFVFLTVKLLEKKYRLSSSLKYYASFFYAISVLPIQLSHFYTTDSFMNFFTFGSFYFSLRFYYRRGIKNLILSAVFIGLAISCKVSAVYILPLILFLITVPYLSFRLLDLSRVEKSLSKFKKGFLDYARNDIWTLMVTISIFFLVTYIVTRLTDPYYFASSSFFNFQLNPNFLESIKSLSIYNKPDVWYPPGVQWIHKGIFFGLQNIVFYGLGILYAVFAFTGIITLFKIKKYRKLEIMGVLIWAFLFFIYQSTQFTKTMRYFIILYPFLAIFAGFGINYLLSFRVKRKRNRGIPFFDLLFYVIPAKAGIQENTGSLVGVRDDKQGVGDDNGNNVIPYKLHITFILILLIWPASFSSIYFSKNSRVAASEWIYQNLPNNSFILGEYWDDPLPLPIENNYGKQFRGEMLPVFDPDTPEKWIKMNELFNKADYYILSSNRGWGSIPTVPEKYPQMSRFYQQLLSGKTNYKLIKEVHSYPSLQIGNWKVELPDSNSEEAFTVYDHPQVMIFKKENK